MNKVNQSLSAAVTLVAASGLVIFVLTPAITFLVFSCLVRVGQSSFRN